MLEGVERSRQRLSRETNAEKKALLGQYLTPARTAKFMAGMFTPTGRDHCRLLDAGAGIGTLSVAFIEQWLLANPFFRHVDVDAFEVDTALHSALSRNLNAFKEKGAVRATIYGDDFISVAADTLRGGFFSRKLPEYSHAILNPPYKKIRNLSPHSTALRRVGIQTVNMYTAFVALALSLLSPYGQLVAIIPRSFCSGTYYRPFRKFLLAKAAIRRLHLFVSRSKAFKDDDVLQENVIIMLERHGIQREILISTSTDDSLADLTEYAHPFERIVFPDDPECFIHIPTSTKQGIIEQSPEIKHALADIGVSVSTGPVVDFRLREYLRDAPEPGSAPLLYPCHLADHRVDWPQPNGRKPNAILHTSATEKWLYPNGYYCIVRRFSSKEERRRVVAGVVEPKDFPGSRLLGFENHLNVFHSERKGLTREIAHGLCAFLNTTAFDESFRRFSGHTQVNVTDLRLMKYPQREALEALGKWVLQNGTPTQEELDAKLSRIGA